MANQLIKLNERAWERVFAGAIRAVATAGVFAKPVTGMADGTDLESTARDRGCGQVSRQGRIEDTQGWVHAIEMTGDGWNVLLLIGALTKIPLAVQVGKIQAHAPHWTRALVTQARAHLAGQACRPIVVFDGGFWDGTDRWWLAQQGLTLGVSAETHYGCDRRRPGTSHGWRGDHAGSPGAYGAPWAGPDGVERAAGTGGGRYGRADHSGPPEHGRHRNRLDFQANPIHAVVVRPWQGRDYGPGGKTVFLTKASVQQPLKPFDDDRSLIENGCLKAAKQPVELGHPPQKTERAVRGQVVFPRLRFTLAPASRVPCECEATGGESVGWQRWRRQLLEQTREQVIVWAQGSYGTYIWLHTHSGWASSATIDRSCRRISNSR